MRPVRPVAPVAAALVLAGCGAGGSPPAPGPPSETSAPDGDAAELPDAPDAAAPFVPSEAETHPNAKRLAAEIVRTLLTYAPDDDLDEIAARVAIDEQRRDDLAVAAAALHHEGARSWGEVLYPQLGGLGEVATSQMVLARQTVALPDGTRLEQVRTLDVRLRLEDGAWVFDELAGAGGDPVPRPQELPEVAAAVLDDGRIDLADSARWDIHRGAILPELLALMLGLADEIGPYGVVVLQTGHPYHVFGTDRMSDHTRGRAFDLHRIGDTLVIDDRAEGSAAHRAVRWLYDHPSQPVIGSPWALDAFGGRSFTDTVHLDHLHVAIPEPGARDEPPDEELAAPQDRPRLRVAAGP